ALCSPAPSPIEALAVLRRRAAADLVHRQILLVRGDEPTVAKGILDPPAATFSTKRGGDTGGPPVVFGVSAWISGCSSANMIRESPILISPWPILPPGPSIRITSSAPSALL